MLLHHKYNQSKHYDVVFTYSYVQSINSLHVSSWCTISHCVNFLSFHLVAGVKKSYITLL